MRALLALLLSGLFVASISGVFAEDYNIELNLESSVSESDAGIITGSLSPDTSKVLLIGSEGYAHLISADKAGDRSQDIELNTGKVVDLNDVSWHPRGQSALIAGDFGVALRYEVKDHGITVVNGTGAILGFDLSSVQWRSAGDFAYFGSDDGTLWRFSEGTGFVKIDNSSNSSITGISCHGNYEICVVSSLSNGIGVISQSHQVTWISGTKTDTWIDVDCADPVLNECVAFGSGLRLRPILLNIIDASKTSVGELAQYPTLNGDFISVSSGFDRTTLIHLAPSSTVRYYPLDDVARVQISGQQLQEWDAVISGRQIAFIWENSQNDGFIITTNGNVISFSPVEFVVENNMVTTVILVAVSVSVPGVILGLIYMNSPFLQKKYLAFRKKSRLKKTNKKS